MTWGCFLLAVASLTLAPPGSAPLQMAATLHLGNSVGHVFAYATLAFFPLLYERRHTAILLATALLPFGVLCEYGQSFSPGRVSSLADVAANAIGIVTGVGLGLCLNRKQAC